MNKFIKSTVTLCGLLVLPILNMKGWSESVSFDDPFAETLKSIQQLESDADPKCHATATRLEYLVYGTPLEHAARYRKNEFQKQLVQAVWQRAARLNHSDSAIQAKDVDRALTELFALSPDKANSGWTIALVGEQPETLYISERDLTHYGSIAYSLRAVLAVQQDQLLGLAKPLPRLEDSAVDAVKQGVDLLTLALLQLADRASRQADQSEISLAMIEDAGALLLHSDAQQVAGSATDKAGEQSGTAARQSTGLLNKIIANKLAAYDAYNEVSQQLFQRNLQVYFAKARLPRQADAQKALSTYLTEAVTAFSGSLYLQAQVFAGQQGLIGEDQVQRAVDLLLPHELNDYEDVIFFPHFDRDRRETIESYDMDAFRDSGLHWRYLSYALDDLADQKQLEADPFAAELLSESIAHYAVLLLRYAGDAALEAMSENGLDEPELAPENIAASYSRIQQLAGQHASTPDRTEPEQRLASAPEQQDKPGGQIYFTQANALWGFDAVHRSSDWLSRLMRSYLKSGDNTGNINIPPAFGGAGIAAEDFDNDGRVDVLQLSGRGNRLFRNTETGFVEVTDVSGLSWRREQDNLPGEPRQPLVADLDNDGDQDVIITYVNDVHRVYENRGDGTFIDRTEKANLGGEGLVGGPATLLDVDNDGLLDLYIAYFGNYLKGVLPTLKRRNDNGLPNALFLNKGGFQFEEAPDALGAANSGWGQAVTHTDLNQDGWQDLIVGNDFGVNGYYINQKGKGFADRAPQFGTDKPSYTMNLSVSDLNRDGLADIYVSNIVTMNKDERYVLPSSDTQQKFNPDKLGNLRVIEANDLFLSKVEEQRLRYDLSDLVGRGAQATGWAWGAEFFDVDSDGDDDLYVTNGMNDYFVYSKRNPYHEQEGVEGALIFPDASRAANLFFLNSGGRLVDKSKASGLDLIANSRAIAYFDYEGDGDLDIVLNNYHDQAYVYRNNAELLNNNWLYIRLEGDPEKGVNKDAIGAQILVGFGELGGNAENQGYVWRQVSSSQAYLSVHPKTQHIGLGKATEARVVVIWPNGKRETFGVLPANGKYLLKYGAG